MQQTTPSIKLGAFDCPTCHVYTTQSWYRLSALQFARGELPLVVSEAYFERIKRESKSPAKEIEDYIDRAQPLLNGKPRIESNDSYGKIMSNMAVSRCYNCDNIAVWVYDHLVFPLTADFPQANNDTPEHIKKDYEEAGMIVGLSPRGSAAIMRLAIQKLCKELGERGKNVNDDIASLVRKGLDKRVQQALDVVRVIGNEAVHPGQIDLNDDRETAYLLFGLFNLIVEKTISEPNHVARIYASLPADKLASISHRDADPTLTTLK